MARIRGRITKDDIRSAALRRWNGRARVTTDWINLYHEPELFLPSGDCLVYLREPGQSGRGPSFRIHCSQLLVKGFRSLVDRTSLRRIVQPVASDAMPSSPSYLGEEATFLMRELYLPAPPDATIDEIIDHHLTTRNVFAFLYNLPLAGRALGTSLVALKERLDVYRPDQDLRNQLEMLSYLEAHRYLDFRECVDHALAALYFAETLHLEGLWIDAFSHCVGMSYKGLRASLEFPAVSRTAKAMINKARLEMDVRLDQVNRSVMNFFEIDLSGQLFGLHQSAREHFDRFRSFLHTFYIEQHGFWPPQEFENEKFKAALYSAMYSDFRNLYHHLVDSESSTLADNSATSGVCTLQIIQAFDKRKNYEALPHSLPQIPTVDAAQASGSQAQKRGTTLNPIRRRRADREARNEVFMQALTDSSNRDWNIMRCLLVRRYSEFERQTVLDEFESISLADGRKIRWILIYAILQTLISVLQAPQQVRNTEGLSYPLCCYPPKAMPWKLGSIDQSQMGEPESEEKKAELVPDNNYTHTNASDSSLTSLTKKDRRHSLPIRSNENTTSARTRHSSLRRLLVGKSASVASPTPSASVSRPAYCEIFVQGYGNGLNEVKLERSESQPERPPPSEITTAAGDETNSERPDTPPSPTTTVSRESSSASGYSSRSTETDSSTDESQDMDHPSVNGECECDNSPTAAATATASPSPSSSSSHLKGDVKLPKGKGKEGRRVQFKVQEVATSDIH